MATAQEIREEIRVAIGDDNPASEEFTDEQLNLFIRTALRKLKNVVNLTITISNGAFSSAPTDAQAYLISLQVQCFISQRRLRDTLGKGVSINTNGYNVDTSKPIAGRLQDVSGDYSPCAQLEKAIADYITNNPGLGIPDVLDYAENIWSGNRNAYEDVDFNGDGTGRIYGDGSGKSRTYYDHYNDGRGDHR